MSGRAVPFSAVSSTLMVSFLLSVVSCCIGHWGWHLFSTVRRSPSPPRQSLWDVLLSAVQSDQYGCTEEIFEVRVAGTDADGMDTYETRWCTAQGNPRPPQIQVQSACCAVASVLLLGLTAVTMLDVANRRSKCSLQPDCDGVNWCSEKDQMGPLIFIPRVAS